jgi:hypothetical protein
VEKVELYQRPSVSKLRQMQLEPDRAIEAFRSKAQLHGVPLSLIGDAISRTLVAMGEKVGYADSCHPARFVTFQAFLKQRKEGLCRFRCLTNSPLSYCFPVELHNRTVRDAVNHMLEKRGAMSATHFVNSPIGTPAASAPDGHAPSGAAAAAAAAAVSMFRTAAVPHDGSQPIAMSRNSSGTNNVSVLSCADDGLGISDVD